MKPGESDPASGQFHTTQWTLVVAAAESGAAGSADALGQLCAAYWPPLYSYARRSGYSMQAAEDVTQSFFAQLLEKQSLKSADRERGRFRSFLLTSLKNFLANERKAARAQKRGGGQTPLSLDVNLAESAYQKNLADQETPEQQFERQWALLLLERVLANLQQEFIEADKRAQFEQLRPYLTADSNSADYQALADKEACSEATIKMRVHRLRKRYRQLLEQEIAGTVADPADADDELQHLFAVLSGQSREK